MSDAIQTPQQVTADPAPVNQETPAVQPAEQPMQQSWQTELPQFNSPDDLATAYKNLQREYTTLKGQGQPDNSDPTAQPAEQADGQGGDPASPEGQPGESDQDAQFINWDQADTYIGDDGSLTKDAIETLETHHKIPRELIDRFMGLQQKVQEMNQQTALQMVGGEENYAAIIEFAKEKAPKSLDLLNDDDQWEVTLAGLMAAAQQHGVIGGKKPPAEPGEAPGTGQPTMTEGPLSPAEFARMTLDPKYNVDMEWTKQVQRRAAAGRR